MKHFWIICLVGIVILFSVANLFAQWEPDVRLTFDTFDNADSHIYYNNAWQIAAIGDTVYVVWLDKRDGNAEIYYKRNPTGNIGIKEDQIIKPNTSMTKVKVFQNPFINALQINTCLKVRVYDVSSRLIVEVKDEWNGRNSEGKEVKAGVYFLKSNGLEIEKVVKLGK